MVWILVEAMVGENKKGIVGDNDSMWIDVTMTKRQVDGTFSNNYEITVIYSGIMYSLFMCNHVYFCFIMNYLNAC